MPVKLTPEQYQKKQAQRLKAALGDMREGIERVTEAPGAKAAKAADKWHAAVSQPDVKAKWQRRVGSVTLDDWKSKMINKGLPRVSAGIDNAAPKVIKFAAELFAHQNKLLEQLKTMPDLTLEDSINRASWWIREMNKFKRGG